MNRQAYEKAGRRAETLAVWYLRVKGYRILSRRYKTRLGEIDIVARKKDLLAIVEVKQRETHAAAKNSISYEATQRIANAAEIYFSQTPEVQNLGLRFDLIFVIGKWKIRHIQNAWRHY